MGLVQHPIKTGRGRGLSQRIRPRPATCFFFLANTRRRSSDLGRFTLNRADLGLIGRNGRFKSKFKKKKKKVQNASFELNNKPYFSLLHPNTKVQLSLTPSLVFHSLYALASLPLSLLSVSPVAVRHSTRQPLSHSFKLQLTSSKHQSSAFSHSVTHLSLSLCFRLSAFVSALRLPCGCETLSQTATQSLQFI